MRQNESPEKYLFNSHQLFDIPTILDKVIMEIRIKGKIEDIADFNRSCRIFGFRLPPKQNLALIDQKLSIPYFFTFENSGRDRGNFLTNFTTSRRAILMQFFGS